MNAMESIECKCETEFKSISDMNCKQEGEVLDMDEQVGLYLTSNSLMVSKVTHWFSGAPIPTFIYTNETVREIYVKASLPEPINVSFLNEYDCVLEFSTEFELHKIAMNLQQIFTVVWLWCRYHLWCGY